MTMRCKFCGQTASRMIILALLQELGASVHPGPLKCPDRDDDGEHEMVDDSEVVAS